MSVPESPTEMEATFQRLRDQLVSQALRLAGNLDDAEDIVQDVYLKALESVRGGQWIEHPERWLRRTLRNTAIDRLRLRKVTISPDELQLSAPVELDHGRALRGCLAPLARSLAPIYADALLRTDLGEGRMQDLAADHAIGLSAAKSRVQRARNQLAEEIKRCCEAISAPSEPYLRSLGHSPCCPVRGTLTSTEPGKSECCD